MLLDLGFSCLIRLDSWLPAPHIVAPPKWTQATFLENVTINSDWMSTWVAQIPPCLNFYLQLPRGLGYLGFLAAGEIKQPRPVQYAGYFDPREARMLNESEVVAQISGDELFIKYQAPIWLVDQKQRLWKLRIFNNPLTIDPLKEWYLYRLKNGADEAENLLENIIESRALSGFVSCVPHSLLSLVGVGLQQKLIPGFQFWDLITHEMLNNKSFNQFVSDLLINDQKIECYPLGFMIKRPGVYFRSHAWKI